MENPKIYFINRIDNTNTGDIWSSPLLYYSYFFQKYNIVRQDIENPDCSKISKNDIVIIGGGGLLNAFDKWNKNINDLINTGATVISWGVGFNSHYDITKPNLSCNLNGFKLITIRDYQHPTNIEWLPCVSCMHSSLLKKKDIKRRIGIVEHKSYKITEQILSQYEKIDNTYSIEKIADFIASSEIVITNTYHITYWALLMQKKVIVMDTFSSKFEYFKYKPVFYTGDIEKDISQANIVKDFLIEAKELNNQFFEKTQQIIKHKINCEASFSTKIFNRLKILIWKRESELRKYIIVLKWVFPNLHRHSLRW